MNARRQEDCVRGGSRLSLLVVRGGERLARARAQGLLDEPAGLAAFAAGEAAGLDLCLAAGGSR